MQPWKVSVGLTVMSTALAVTTLGGELHYLKPYWRVLLADYAVPIALYGGLAILTLAFLFYAGARALGLADVGRKVDLVERSFRRGEVGDSDLSEKLDREGKGKFN